MTKIPYKQIYDESDGISWALKRRQYPKVVLHEVEYRTITHEENSRLDEGDTYETAICKCPECGKHTVEGRWNFEHNLDFVCRNDDCAFFEEERFVEKIVKINEEE